MTRFGRLVALVAMALCGTVLAVAPDAAERPVNWTAPPFWTPPATSAAPAPEARAALGPVLPTALPFVALAPCRVVDTRGNAPLTGGFLPAATERSYIVTGVCGIPANAQALSLNATVVNPVGPGFLVLYPQGGAFPPVSTLNFLGHDVIVNAAVVPISVSGGITMALGVSGGDVVLDVNGYYAPTPTVTSLNALTGDVTLASGANVTIAPAGNTITIGTSGVVTGVGAGTGLAATGPATSPTLLIPPAGITADRIATGQVVKSVNGATDAVSIVGGGGVTVQTSGGSVTISSPVSSSAYGGNVVTTVDSAGNVGSYAAISIGADGLPVVSYYDVTNAHLKVLKCGNAACNSGNVATTVDPAAGVGKWTSIVVPADGLPAISYYDETNGDLKFVKCGNGSCTGGNTIRTLDSTGNVGTNTAVAIGANGFPTVAFRDETGNQLKLAVCADASCSAPAVAASAFGTSAQGIGTSLTFTGSGASALPALSGLGGFANAYYATCPNATCTGGGASLFNIAIGGGNAAATTTSVMTSPSGVVRIAFFDSTNGDLAVSPNTFLASVAVDTGGTVGQYPSLAFGPDGLPVVSYYDATNGDLKVAKCGNTSCSSGNFFSSPDTGGNVGQWTSLTIGADGLPVVAYYDVTNGDLKVLKCGNAACSALSGRR